MSNEPRANGSRPPLGSWARLYLVVIAVHVLMLLLLWWLSSSFNIRMPQGS